MQISEKVQEIYDLIENNCSYNSIYEELFDIEADLSRVFLDETEKFIYNLLFIKEKISEFDVFRLEKMGIIESVTFPEEVKELLDFSDEPKLEVPITFQVICEYLKRKNQRYDETDKTTIVCKYIEMIYSFKSTFYEPCNDDEKADYYSKLIYRYCDCVVNLLMKYAKLIVNGERTRGVFSVNIESISKELILDKEKMLLEFMLGADQIYCEVVEKSNKFINDAYNGNLLNREIVNPSERIREEIPKIYSNLYGKNGNYLRLDELLEIILKKYYPSKTILGLQLFSMEMIKVHKILYNSYNDKIDFLYDEYQKGTNLEIDKYNSSLIEYQDTNGLPYGIITNSVVGAALYFVQDASSRYSQIKRVQRNSYKKLKKNEDILLDKYSRLIWQTGTAELDKYYSILKRNILVASKIVADYFDIDYQKVFDVYQKYIKDKQSKELNEYETQIREIELQISNNQNKIQEYQLEFDNIGFVLFGNQRVRKRELKKLIDELNNKILELKSKRNSL